MDYTWRIDTTIEPQALRSALDPFRPFRNEVHFSSGFCTREFGDTVQFSNPEPLDKLYCFLSEITFDTETRILDIGCNLAYYCHYFVKRGVRLAVGVESDSRLFSAAIVLRSIAGLSDRHLILLQGDFGDQLTQGAAAQHGQYDLILFLGSSNNMRSLSAALLALPNLLRPGGLAVIEYLAIPTDDPICRFHRDGFRLDPSNVWSFSEAFLDSFLASVGISKVLRTLEWGNPEVLGEYKKIMGIYRREGG
jgi:SAM-dependent methyltransferase